MNSYILKALYGAREEDELKKKKMHTTRGTYNYVLGALGIRRRKKKKKMHC